MLIKTKKPMAAVLAAVMLFAMCSCTGKGKEGGGDTNPDVDYKFHWMDSNLIENVEKMGGAK